MLQMPSSPKKNSSQKTTSPKKSWGYCFFSSVFLALAILIAWCMAAQPAILNRYDLFGELYYIPDILLGICCGLALLGILQFSAQDAVPRMKRHIKYGGPFAFGIVVMLVAKLFFPPAVVFDMTVMVHPLDDKVEIPLEHSGVLVLRLENDPLKQSFGSHGETVFHGIPSEFKGLNVFVGLESATWKLSPQEQQVTLTPQHTASVSVSPKKEPREE
ncbi:hypothetical protein [Desulfovibrio inopinatus]|uniref:hypothetical protein n=1 Tax=Desulfovibrio inopinatus TaxID=102109 RepID=UPI0004147254|nr:hypothetical protein [Desulfovibrio inopinatus]